MFAVLPCTKLHASLVLLTPMRSWSQPQLARLPRIRGSCSVTGAHMRSRDCKVNGNCSALTNLRDRCRTDTSRCLAGAAPHGPPIETTDSTRLSLSEVPTTPAFVWNRTIVLLARAFWVDSGSESLGTPNRIRTGAAAVKGRCPRPLDDGGGTVHDARDYQGYRAPIGTPAADVSGTDGAATISGAWYVQVRKVCTVPTTMTVAPSTCTSTSSAGRWVKYWV